MSVIVKGMEMPKDCYDCPLHDGENGRCNILGITVCDYIPKECPLVEVVHCKDCKFNQNEDGTTGCDFHNFWCAYDDCYCNFGQRREE